MDNNVITILVDSVFSDCLSKGRTLESSTPFLDSIIPNSLYAPNIYSFGPYTDAATKGLFCGNRTLDDYGYYYGINSSEYNHYRIFKETGYETVGLYYPYYLISSKVLQYIDHNIYISGFLYESVWNGKLKYYAHKKKKEKLSETEYLIIEKCISMVFDCWRNFYNNIDENESDVIIRRIKNEKNDGKKLLWEEIKKFAEAPREYIDCILEQGMSHQLAKINDYDLNELVLKDVVQKTFKSHKFFFLQISLQEFKLNLKNSKLSFKALFRGIKDFFFYKKCDGLKRYIVNFGMSFLGNFFLKFKAKRSMWQLEASMMTQINSVFNYIDNKSNKQKPFYISMHVEEPHNYVAYFSYDINDMQLIDEEIEYLIPLVNNLGSNFKGNVIYQLSLRYIDLCLKRLFDGLKKRGILDKTTIMFMADHGSSYTLNPLRNSVVNNFFIENYKTPLLIWNQKKDMVWKGTYNGYYQGSDVFPTLCNILGIDTQNKFSGKSILSIPEGRDYVITEYMGPGCPDMLSRDIWMSINNRKIFVAIKIKINSILDDNCIVEIYDLVQDPYQLFNRVDALRSTTEIKELLAKLNERYVEICKSTSEIILNFDVFNVTS